MADWYRSSVVTSEEGMIADLSRLGQALIDYEDISPHLTDDEEKRIVDYVRAIAKMSYDKISRRHSHWDEADRAHDVYVPPDATKFREKAVIGQTRAIADTVVTYQMAALTGRNPMFQLEGLDRTSRRSAAILERVLHAQMRRTAGEAGIAQLVVDSVRYGISPTKIVWDAGLNTNLIVNWNPRRFYPDPRVSWGDWQNGQFMILSDFTSYDNLLMSGLYPKLKMYPGLRKSDRLKSSWDCHRVFREQGRGLVVNPSEDDKNSESFFKLGSARVVDEVWCRIPGWQLGMPGIMMFWLVIVVMDEDVVIRFQLSPNGKQFPVVPGGLFFDKHKNFSQSLYDMLLPLHDIATWLLRSRIDNVQAALNNLVIADPTQISIMDFIDRNPANVIRALPGADLRSAIRIEAIPDVTRGHWSDIAAIADLQQRLSAASDAQQGMPTADVRTATEIQRLSQLGSQRLGVLARVLSATTVRPLVHMMVGNIQDALDFEGSVRIGQESVPELLRSAVQDDYLDFDVKALQGNVNYLVVDGTLPLEPTRSPETWMNMIGVANQTGLGLELDLKKMALEAIRSMGVPDVDQFRIDPSKQGELSPSQQLQLMEKMRGMSVKDDETVGREVERGNLVPVRQAR